MNSKSTPLIVSVGEILWDLLPSGPQFGGAPANFAHHARLLGAEVAMVSAVGNDELGRQALANMSDTGLDVSQVTVNDSLPTGAVKVQIDDSGQASYHFNELDAWDQLEWSDELAELAGRADAICFGTLGQRHNKSRETIQRLVQATPDTALRVFDINLRPPYCSDEVIDESLAIANVLKLNDDELAQLAKRFQLDGSEPEIAQQLVRKYDLKLMAVTRGRRGGLLVSGDRISEQPAIPVEIVDTVGAGDSFTAVVTLGTIRGFDLDKTNACACRIAEYVCTRAGATPPLPSVLCEFV